MEVMNILWRNAKWRFFRPISIALTIIQPLIWLVLYGEIAKQSMGNSANGNYLEFILPGIMVLVILSCCSSGGYVNFIMKSKGSFYRILIAPIKRTSIVMGQLLEPVLLSLVEISIMLIIAVIMSARISTGVIGLIMMVPLIFVAAFFMSAIAYTISLWLPNEAIYETVMNLVVLSIFFTSTALFPQENLSGGLKLAISLNPFSHIINCLRNLITNNAVDLNSMAVVFMIFIVLCCISFFMAVMSLRKETVN